MYLDVVRTLTCPRIFCSSRRSTPASSRWVAKLWRSEWHEIFFYAELGDNGFHGCLDAAPVQRHGHQMGVFHPSLPTRKDKPGMPMNLPEILEDTQGVYRQRHQSVFVSFGISDMDSHCCRVDIADSQVDTFAETQPHAVGGEEKDLVTEDIGCSKQLTQLFNSQDIRDSFGFGRSYQGKICPVFAQDIGVKEFQTIEVELDRAPGM